ncbi:hypothetical protein FA13DRAFT_1646929 [Coprinellus micaceus]|uniref:Uncharacterized protein n=1 Tax=Coprinellus micaceus TaxID=71717 RepID=A0A4Y7SD32_COPMI|nr:hypothetical protein FA13DRAFT_1646929 [Coprinellus micaceus]
MNHKRVSGILHSQEYERTVGFICMAFGHKKLAAQLFRDSLQFSTRSRSETNDRPRAQSTSPSKTSKLDSNIRSPATSMKSSSRAVSLQEGYSLSFEEPVPAYDAREFSVDFNKDLGNLKSFPPWEGKIPVDSFVVVAYTVSVYWNDSKGWSVSFNLKWVMVLGTPS